MTAPGFSVFSRIVLPLDGTAESAAALPVARRIAEAADATLHIVHVSDREMTGTEVRKELGLPDEAIDSAVLKAMRGAPAECILSAAKDGGTLVVMTTHGAHAGSDIGLGSVAENVLRSCPTPILLVAPNRNYSQWRLREVLLPHDGTPASAAALAPAIGLTHRTGATLRVVHITGKRAKPAGESGAMDVPRYIDQPQHEWPAWSNEFIERMEAMASGLREPRVHLQLAAGDPDTEIVRLAREHGSDLVVLAWHGDIGPRHGRIVKTLLREAPCPILVLPFTESGFRARG